MPILIHAGRGIPALGRDTLELAQRYPGARFILAHAAVSDLAWLWRLMPDHPNLFIDSSWWNPADFVALFSLVPPGQILWASDNPYGQPLHAAAFQLRYALLVGLRGDQIRSIAGGQIERILAGEEPAYFGPPPAPPGPQDPGMERVVSHLTTAIGRAMAEGDPSESVALGRLAVDLEGPEAETGAGDPAPARPRRPPRRSPTPRPPLPPRRPLRDVGAGRRAHPRHRPPAASRLTPPPQCVRTFPGMRGLLRTHRVRSRLTGTGRRDRLLAVKRICTVGVYGADLEAFLATLREAKVDLLLDVRQRRGVRGHEYAWANAKRLEAELREAGIVYQHLPELAPTTSMREAQYEADAERGEGKRSRTVISQVYAERYTEEILEPVDLDPLVRFIGRSTAALFCVERDAVACHRSLIAARLAREYGSRIENLRP